MIGKKKQVEELAKEKVEVTKEEKIIDKTVPNPRVAMAFIDTAIRENVLCISNIPKQYKHDIATCSSYLVEYINEPVEVRIADTLQEKINDGTLKSYNRSYEENGYTITLMIKKEK